MGCAHNGCTFRGCRFDTVRGAVSVTDAVSVLTTHGFAVKVNGEGTVRALVGSTTGRGDGMVTDYSWEDVPMGSLRELRDWLGY